MLFKNLEENEIAELLEIENYAFISPWTREQFLYELQENPFAHILVAKENAQIVGFMDYWITFETVQVNQIAVAKAWRKQGIATKLFLEMMRRLAKEEIDVISLEVRVQNEAAINLYKKWGFEMIRKKEHYYDNGDDAWYMIKRVGETNE